jgi:hypothetical protein
VRSGILGAAPQTPLPRSYRVGISNSSGRLLLLLTFLLAGLPDVLTAQPGEWAITLGAGPSIGAVNWKP